MTAWCLRGETEHKFLSSCGSLININIGVLYYEKEFQCRVGRYIVGNKLGKKNTKDKKLTWVKKLPWLRLAGSCINISVVPVDGQSSC